jgi:hypothetical protein
MADLSNLGSGPIETLGDHGTDKEGLIVVVNIAKQDPQLRLT